MIPLKEDGSLDIERINSLTLEEYMYMMGELTSKQVDEYRSKIPKNKSQGPVKDIKVDYCFDDPRSGINLEKFLEQKKRKYGIK